ncbi:cytochrome b/b6 domain-containing protein [Halomonas sp. JS92-SW72]|uniref:cytochrome b n=1 Tax=Halomonas sp. JS92-SW72 TaxID=2306583 RepID=UPI000E5AB071|nr:cytochrome b/b6 domain-containing protein [Halomonas sp. JS92-SW72]AXY41758.1 cytochrome b [Halomonas sp. JS92-SW72]
MNWLDSAQRYGAVSRALHWGMATLLILMLGTEWLAELVGMSEREAMTLHKSVGLLLLGLLVFRLLWRGVNHGRLESHAHWQWAARLGHLALYAAMLLIPVSGLLAALGSGHGVEFFGTALIAPGPEIEWLEEAAEESHEVLANLLWLLIGVHVLASLAHQFWLRDHTLKRMV